jgi:hypothetical protein
MAPHMYTDLVVIDVAHWIWVNNCIINGRKMAKLRYQDVNLYRVAYSLSECCSRKSPLDGYVNAV